MIKRILMTTALLLPAFVWAQQSAPSDACQSMQAERIELQIALRKTNRLDKIEAYKQRIQSLSARISETCFSEEQIAELKSSLYNPDIAELENSLAKPLTEQAYISKQAAWDRFYVMPPRCAARSLQLQNLESCLENKQIQFQQFDMLWQQKSAQLARTEAKPTDSFHEFVLPSKAERAKLSAEQELKRYSYSTDSFLPTNIIVLCALAVSVFFGLIFIFHWLMRPRPVVKWVFS